MNKQRILLALMIICFLPIFAFSQNGEKPSIEERIDQLFAEWDKPTSPGATVAVAQNGEIVFSKGYGSANLEYDIPNSPTTIYHVASVSKQFTVFSILLLQEEGKLSLDDAIQKHIPEVPDFGKRITLRHLAAHTSGMRDQWNLLALAGWRLDDVITKEHVLALIKRQKELNFEPGAEYYYSNSGYTLLAEVVARVSKKTFAEFTKERIFEPLGMTNTLFYDDHEKIVKNRAYSYQPDRENGGYKKVVLSYANVGATSLFTTVEDLCLWAMNFKDLKVGSADIIKEMNTQTTLNNGETISGALGQFVTPYKGLHQIQHGGADAGYRTYLGRFPDQDFAVTVFSNWGDFNPNQKALQVVDFYLEEFQTESTDNQSNNSGFVERESIKLSKKKLKAFEGNYWNEAGSYSRRIYLKNDTLRYNRGGNNESPLAPIGKNEFQMLNVTVDLIVKFEKEGEQKNMIVVINDGDPIHSEGYEPTKYSKSILKEFEGTYYSEELETSYTFEAKADHLLVKHIRNREFTLQPVKGDKFNMGHWYFRSVDFVRNDNGEIEGLKVNSGRVRNLWFEKQ